MVFKSVDFINIYAIRNRERGRESERQGDHCVFKTQETVQNYFLCTAFICISQKPRQKAEKVFVISILLLRRTPEIISSPPKVTLVGSKDKPDLLSVFWVCVVCHIHILRGLLHN